MLTILTPPIQGTLTFENGVFEGTWENGRESGGQFIFNDGLPFTKENWNYCVSVKTNALPRLSPIVYCPTTKHQTSDAHCPSSINHPLIDYPAPIQSVKDRRFWSEYADGIKPAGETNRTDTGVKPNLPKGCFDVGNGCVREQRLHASLRPDIHP